MIPSLDVPLQPGRLLRLVHVDHVVASQLLVRCNVDQGDDLGDPSKHGMFYDVPFAVGLEGMVDLVAQGRPVVLQGDEVFRDVHVVGVNDLKSSFVLLMRQKDREDLKTLES